MTFYTCEQCKKTFSRGYDYKKHLNRKTPCKIGDSDMTVTQYKCLCNKLFDRKDNFREHTKICKEYKDNIAEYKAAQKQGGNIENTINGDNNNIKINNHTTNNYFKSNNIEVRLNSFPNATGIDLNVLDKINTENDCITALITAVHFDLSRMDNHNVSCHTSDMSSGKVRVGNKWIVRSMKEIVKQLFNKRRDDLREMIEKSTLLDKHVKERFLSMLNLTPAQIKTATSKITRDT